ncbi:N-acetylmuramoyl-L-alanine amidase [Fictibacillus enclensis]|uniref:N-acetylmuramoyl-L-alanine amidase n=1 Tax=Fictibacillus enclensis TaxID=1017270 RepID=UPI0025A2E975|nr:N-acetylmuramoyl-L-alanine amidase [Fictibacillus enclensis]MDM5337741.1 N-acetylmuramoyl-L-alanine amidase [Fictibacillus enclensis]
MGANYKITTMLLDQRWNQRPGGNRIPRYAVAHDTGNEGSTAKQNYKYFNSRNLEASAHVFIDDQEILLIIPLSEKAWHVRSQVSDANDWALGVELCHGGNIIWKEAYKRYVWFFAWLCRHYGWIPEHSIKGHFQLDPARRADPVNAFKKYGVTYQHFLQAVEAELTTMGPVDDEKEQGTLYRVQIGSYKQRENAVEMVKLAKKAGFDAVITKTK